MEFLPAVRYGVFALVLASALISIASWAVRTRQVNPFGPIGRTLRNISEPIVRPVERLLLKNGGNPQNAPFWIFGIALLGGIAFIALANWSAGEMGRVAFASQSGRGILRLIVYYAGQILLLALIVRVIGSWIGQYRYSRWMRPFYFLTDWFIEPLRKIIPPIGMLDITPIVAWFLLRLVLGWVMQIL